MAPVQLQILVVEDDPDLREALAALVSADGATVRTAENVANARELLSRDPFDAALVDLTLPDGSGLDLLRDPDALGQPEYVVVTGDATAETAVQALRRGALDYLTKPIDRSRLRSTLENVRRTRALRHEVADLREQLRELGCFGPMVGRSDPMRKVYELIERVAPTDSTVFVVGESGTGKRAGGRDDPPPLDAPERALRHDELRRDRADADRERAVRPPKRERSPGAVQKKRRLFRARRRRARCFWTRSGT